MTRTNNLSELLKNVEEIRKTKYPHIPQELVTQLISTEFEQQDSRSDACEQVTKIVEKYLSNL